jgi:hypothetical protein
LQVIAAFHPKITKEIADNSPKSALKCHFVAYIHIDGQLIEFGKFLNNLNNYLVIVFRFESRICSSLRHYYSKSTDQRRSCRCQWNHWRFEEQACSCDGIDSRIALLYDLFNIISCCCLLKNLSVDFTLLICVGD